MRVHPKGERRVVVPEVLDEFLDRHRPRGSSRRTSAQAQARRDAEQSALDAARGALSEAQTDLDLLDQAVKVDPFAFDIEARRDRTTRTCWRTLLQAAVAKDAPTVDTPDRFELRRARIAAFQWLRITKFGAEIEAEARALAEQNPTPRELVVRAQQLAAVGPPGRPDFWGPFGG